MTPGPFSLAHPLQYGGCGLTSVTLLEVIRDMDDFNNSTIQAPHIEMPQTQPFGNDRAASNASARRWMAGLVSGSVIALLVTLLASRSALGVNVLLLTDSNGSLTTVESNIKTNLQAAGYTVNTLWDGDSQANYTAAFANNDCVYIPSDVSTTEGCERLTALASERPSGRPTTIWSMLMPRSPSSVPTRPIMPGTSE